MEQYRRRNFLINKGFQIRYCFYVCSWLFALSLVYPFIIYEVFDFFIRYLAIQSPGRSPEVIHHVRTQMIWLLASLQIVFLAITFLISVFVSHRIAGPLDKLNRWLLSGKEGNLRDDLSFRKSDYFRELAIAYNRLVSGIFLRVERNIDRLEKASTGASGTTKADLQATIEDLKTIRQKPGTTEPEADPGV